MSAVHLDDDEWQKVMGVIATAPWSVANPLLMKIGEQLRRQASGNSQEMPVNRAQVEGDKARN
jgi:hypothetical protein